MKLRSFHFFVIFSLFSAMIQMSCANEFEKVRTSNDPKLILKKANEYFKNEAYLSSQTLYELAVQYYRGKTEAEDIFFNLAYTFYHTGEYITAAHYFKNFTTTFYNSKRKEEADFMAAYSNYKLSPNFRLDQSYSLKSIDELQEFITKYPESKRIAECNKLIDEMRAKLERKAFDQGLLYYKIGQFQSAVTSFEVMLKDFPGSAFETEAKFLLIKSSLELADNSIEGKQEERYQETLMFCKRYMDKMKDKKKKDEVKEIFDKVTNKLKSIKV